MNNITIKQEKFDLLPMGEYPAVIDEITQTEGLYGEQLQFIFTITAPEYAGNRQMAWASCKFSKRSKLYAWTKAAMAGRDIPEDYDFQSNDLIGHQVSLAIICGTKEDGTEFNKTIDVKVYKGDSAPAKPAPQKLAPTQVADGFFQDDDVQEVKKVREVTDGIPW